MPSLARHRDNNFDFLRLVLALMVVYQHAVTHYMASWQGGYPSWPFDAGKFGVESFFVISGLMVSWSFLNAADTVAYGIKRIFRIYPLFAAIILIQTAVMLSLMPEGAATAGGTLRYLLFNLMFLDLLQPSIPGMFDPAGSTAINGALWSLRTEILFYLLLPLLIYLWRRFGGWTLAALYLASALFWYFGHAMDVGKFPGRLRLFLAGMAVYALMRAEKLPSGHQLTAIGMISAIALFLGNRVLWFESFFYPLALAGLLCAIGFGISRAWVQRDLSYGIYVFHFPLIVVLLRYPESQLGWPLFLAVVALLCAACAWAASLLIERPGMALGRRLIEWERMHLRLPRWLRVP